MKIDEELAFIDSKLKHLATQLINTHCRDVQTQIVHYQKRKGELDRIKTQERSKETEAFKKFTDFLFGHLPSSEINALLALAGLHNSTPEKLKRDFNLFSKIISDPTRVSIFIDAIEKERHKEENEQILQLTNTIREAQSKNQTLQLQIVAFEENISAQEKKILQNESDMDDLKNQKDQTEKTHQKALEKLNEQAENRDHLLHTAKREYEELSKQYKSKIEHSKSLELTFSALTIEIQELKENNDTIGRQHKEELKKIQEDLIQNQDKSQSLSSQLLEKESLILEQSSQISAFQENGDNQNNEHISLQGKCQELQQKLKKAEDVAFSLRSQQESIEQQFSSALSAWNAIIKEGSEPPFKLNPKWGCIIAKAKEQGGSMLQTEKNIRAILNTFELKDKYISSDYNEIVAICNAQEAQSQGELIQLILEKMKDWEHLQNGTLINQKGIEELIRKIKIDGDNLTPRSFFQLMNELISQSIDMEAQK